MKPKLLYLVHRLPYPPTKGDKIASFNLLRFLAKHYEVYLGTFIDDPGDRQYRDKLLQYCADICAPELDRQSAKLASLRGLLTGEALSLPYLRSSDLQEWTIEVLRTQKPQQIVVFSSPMAQYVSGRMPAECVSLFDMVDVDSEKWRTFARRKRWPLSWLLRREADKLLAFERKMATEFTATVLVSHEEAELFRQLAPESAARVTFRTQGVDSEFFDPAGNYPNPYPDNARALVFTGAMDYLPNVDAVTWLVEEAFPSIRAAVADAQLFIVGMRPSPAVQQMDQLPGVTVTGGVRDIRPFLAHARAAIIPLRIARGIQNKVLEAMAMQLPVIATPGAMTGIRPYEGFEPFVSDDIQAMAKQAIALLSGERIVETAARECVMQRYNWDSNLQRIGRLLESGKIEPDS